MRNIFFTDNFINIINDEEFSIELKKYKLGKFTDPKDGTKITSPKDITKSYMLTQDITSPTDSYYLFESIFSKSDSILRINIKIPSYDESMSESDNSASIYKILYIMYTDILTGIEDIAFIIYDRITSNETEFKLNGLNLSRHNNLLNISIPFKCNVLTKLDLNTSHLESEGVDYLNYNYINNDMYDSFYVDKYSYDRSYYNSISNNSPFYGLTTINKFGLRSY